ncbi:MAG: YdeI/OmpD-associated family protein [Chloroflexota bacterium]
MKFMATLALHGKSATGIEIPSTVIDGLGGGKRAKVRVTINGYRYQSTIGSMGGKSLLPVSADIRAAAGIAASDDITVDLELDDQPRVVDVPGDLAAALASANLREAFDSLAPSRRRAHVLAVESAKTPETRARRMDRIIGELRQ